MRRCWLIAILLLVVGCSKDIDFELSQDQAQNRILSGIIADEKDEDNESRVYLDNKIRIRWNKGDLISVFDGTTRNKEFAFLGADGSSAGDFSDNSAGTIGTGKAIDRIYGLYPYASSTEYCYGEDESEADYLRYTLPATQTYRPNSIGLNANLMVAATANKSDKTLVFRNVCSYLRLKLYGADQTVSSIVFKGNTDEVLSGDVAITATYGKAPTIKMLGAAEEDNKTITLDCSEGVTVGSTSDEATEFWLVVPPLNFPNGFTITVKGEDNMGQEIVINNNLTFARNTYNTITREVAMTEVSDPSTEIPNNQIWYTATEKVTPYKTDVFGANIVSNTYENGKGVIKFDGAVTSIGRNAFAYCSSLTEITIPNSVTSITSAFYKCSSLTSITISNSVTSIGSNAFQYCSSLTEITIPNSVTSIGNDAFAYCSSLTEITIPNSVTSIGNDAFDSCKSLTSITIPNSVISIGASAFRSCSSLTEITIPNSVTSIGDSAFSGCSSLTEIALPNNITSIGEGAFIGCSSLQKFYGKFAEDNGRCLINDGVLIAYAEASGTEYTIPNSVTSIGNLAFAYCKSLTSITIPNSVTSIGNRAFSSCYNLTVVTIPNSVTSIGDYAFYYCSSLTSIAIPNSVTSIGSYAFYSCKSLTEITLPNSVTSIEEGAFSSCSSLTNVSIGNSVTSIGEGAFIGCSSLTEITLPNSVISIGASAFRSCSSLQKIFCKRTTPPTGGDYMFDKIHSSAKIYVPAGSGEAYKTAQYWSDYADIIVEDLDRVEDPNPSSTSFKRRAMVMQFTGTDCGYCPYIIEPLETMAKDATYKDKFSWAAIHTFNPFSDPAAPSNSEDQQKLGSTFGISGYPTVLVDIGTMVSNSNNNIALNLANLKKAVDNSVANAPSAGISAAMTLDENNRVVTARVSVKAKDSKVYRVSMWLLEDNIKGAQSGSSTINTHDHAVRYVARGTDGSANYVGYELNDGKAMSAGQIADYVFTINIKDQSVKLANCKLIFFVTTSTGNSYTVVNSVVSTDLKTAIPFEYEN